MNLFVCCIIFGALVGLAEPRPSSLDRLEAEILRILEDNDEDNNEDQGYEKACPVSMDSNNLRVEGPDAATPFEVNECAVKEFNPSKSCVDFDVSVCEEACLVGYETDANGCILSCDCKNEGLFEGDIMMTLGEASMFVESEDRAATRYLPRWNNLPFYEGGRRVFKIPYTFSAATAGNGRAVTAIRAAIEAYRTQTCLRFVPRTNERDYLEFFPGRGCYSMVGKRGGKQQISIGRGCEWKGTVMHEMLHAMGFMHEQSRPDRDQTITIVTENIIPQYIRNFMKYSTRYINSMGSPYDIGSIMQYGGTFFTKNGKPTIVNKLTGQPVKAQRNGFSSEDIIQVNKMYKCN